MPTPRQPSLVQRVWALPGELCRSVLCELAGRGHAQQELATVITVAEDVQRLAGIRGRKQRVRSDERGQA